MLPAMNAMHELAAVKRFHIVACMRWDGHERVQGCWLYSEQGRGSQCEAGQAQYDASSFRDCARHLGCQSGYVSRYAQNTQHPCCLNRFQLRTQADSKPPIPQPDRSASNVHRAVAPAVHHRIPTESSVVLECVQIVGVRALPCFARRNRSRTRRRLHFSVTPKGLQCTPQTPPLPLPTTLRFSNRPFRLWMVLKDPTGRAVADALQTSASPPRHTALR
jgi:hypothetical protein